MANVAFQMVKRGQTFVAYSHRPMTLLSPTRISQAVSNHKILEENAPLQNVKLGGHQTYFIHSHYFQMKIAQFADVFQA